MGRYENPRPTNQTPTAIGGRQVGALRYLRELQRIWPINEQNRKAKIAQFAEGFRLAYYKLGLCAIFEEDTVKHE
jgi:hypothetical protein